MAAIRKMKAEVTYQCPNWEHCNEMLMGGMQHGKKTCRFCQKTRSRAYCCLHDQELKVHANGIVDKCAVCLGETKGWFSKPAQFIGEVEEDPMEHIDPRRLMKLTADSMLRNAQKLIKDGYPTDIALKVAHELVVKAK